jgi:gamma-glutamylcyclotransferase (GGCT)/AIG2-like uncharacterized protein YtfP
MLAFVYGSLKEGFGNHGVLGDSPLEGKASLISNSKLVSLGSFPAVVKDQLEDTAILGEVYKVDDKALTRLDRLEGNGSFYNRELRDITMSENGAQRKAWVYFLMSDYGEEVNHLAIDSSNRKVYSWTRD